MPILTYKTLNEAFGKITATAHPLAAFIFSRDQKTIDRFTSELSFGGGAVNQGSIHLRQRARLRKATQRGTTRHAAAWLPGRSARSWPLGLRRDPHGSVKQIDRQELKDGNKEGSSGFPQIMLKQTDSGIQQLYGARERAQDQQRRRRSFVDCRQRKQSQRNCARRRVHG